MATATSAFKQQQQNVKIQLPSGAELIRESLRLVEEKQNNFYQGRFGAAEIAQCVRAGGHLLRSPVPAYQARRIS